MPPGSIVLIATSTRDIVGGGERMGGPAFFAGTALHLLGAEATVITVEGAVADRLRRLHGIRVEVTGGGETVFSIEVDGGERVLRLLSRSAMGPLEVSWRGPCIVSGTMNEIPLEFVEEAAGRGPVLLDVQGFVRVVSDGGEVRNSADSMRRLMARLGGSGVLVRGERYEFPPECQGEGIADCSARYGVDLVMTDAEKPFYAAVGGELYVGHPLEGIHGEPIGLGDVFTAALGHYLYSAMLPFGEAAARASAAATLKLRERHPWFTVPEVEGAARRVVVERRGRIR
ncbi:MAG: hypothetical protein RAK18_01000 [Conexivisphaerales archaeon]|nr:hypothetical protein [Conexivisphaerales archaeon]